MLSRTLPDTHMGLPVGITIMVSSRHVMCEIGQSEKHFTPAVCASQYIVHPSSKECVILVQFVTVPIICKVLIMW